MRRLQYQESTESSMTTKLFMGIYGVGMTTARDWFNRGIRTLDDLKKAHRGVVLTPAQRVGTAVHRPRDNIDLDVDVL